MSIKEWPAGERPREKLLSEGVASLSDAELLAVVVRAGGRGNRNHTFKQCIDRSLCICRKLNRDERWSLGIRRLWADGILLHVFRQ